MPNRPLAQLLIPNQSAFKQYGLNRSHISLALAKFSQHYPNLPKVISLSLISPEKSRQINRRFRRENKPTDVLSFNLKGPHSNRGDIYICPELARKNAQLLNKSLTSEVIFLAKHAMKHLAGIHHR